jgi:ABC-type polar amino acid transport system ATPase subunit
MLFDEPTSALDPEMINEVEAMADLAGGCMTMVAFMDEGHKIEVDTPEQFFQSPQNERTKRFLVQILHM